jgi:hypothetical protein
MMLFTAAIIYGGLFAASLTGQASPTTPPHLPTSAPRPPCTYSPPATSTFVNIPAPVHPTHIMPSSAAAVDSFNASVTNVQLVRHAVYDGSLCSALSAAAQTVGPPDVSGVERIMLAAQGDLQRLLR